MNFPLRLRALLWCMCALFSVAVGVSQATAQSYQIRPGDILRIEVLEDPALNRSVLVAPDGRISVPMAGSLRASGQPVEAVQRSLTARLSGSFANPPNVFISVERLAERRPQLREPKAPPMISVFVMGEALKPGRVEMPVSATLLQAFAMMGGFTKFAAQKRIQLRRTDAKTGVENITSINYREIETGAAAGRMVLRDGDVIIVPQRRLFE